MKKDMLNQRAYAMLTTLWCTDAASFQHAAEAQAEIKKSSLVFRVADFGVCKWCGTKRKSADANKCHKCGGPK